MIVILFSIIIDKLIFKKKTVLSQIKGNENLNDLVNLISECHEFADVALRTNEKRILNQLNKNSQMPSCRFPLPGKIQTRHMKANWYRFKTILIYSSSP